MNQTPPPTDEELLEALLEYWVDGRSGRLMRIHMEQGLPATHPMIVKRSAAIVLIRLPGTPDNVRKDVAEWMRQYEDNMDHYLKE